MSVDTKHYDIFEVTLTPKERQSGVIRLDPYRVSKEWGIGEKDPSGALFHILKTLCRYKNKEGNSGDREAASILATITRLIELNYQDTELIEQVVSNFPYTAVNVQTDSVLIKSYSDV